MFGSEIAIGKDPLNDPSWFHLGAGYAVFVVALAGMVGLAHLLQIDVETVRSWKARLAPLMKSRSRETSLNPPSARTTDTSESKDEY